MVGVVPDCPPAGSRMTAATSPRCKRPSTALMSLGGQSRSWSRICVGTPADIGTSKGGLTAATTPSAQPWKWPWSFTTFGCPV